MSLNTYPPRFATLTSRYSTWQLVVAFSLVAWLSSSLLLDTVIMPTFYLTGMMASPNFATTGYSIFWIFNRIEILWAALVLTGAIGWAKYLRSKQISLKPIVLAIIMMAIALTSTYWFTPAMSALSLNLDGMDVVEAVPSAMNWMHGGYFGLELLKVSLGISLGVLCCQHAITTAPDNS